MYISYWLYVVIRLELFAGLIGLMSLTYTNLHDRYLTATCSKLGKMSQNMSRVAVVDVDLDITKVCVMTLEDRLFCLRPTRAQITLHLFMRISVGRLFS